MFIIISQHYFIYLSIIMRFFLYYICITTLLIITLNIHAATIVTSLRPLGFIAAAIANDITTVEIVLPKYASPHEYLLKPSDIMRIKNADLFIWIGPELENFLTDLTSIISVDKQIILSKISTITPLLIKNNKQFTKNMNNMYHPTNKIWKFNDINSNKYNMHLWLSPEIAYHVAVAIHKYLIKLIPTEKQKLDYNLQNFNIGLMNNDKNVIATLSPIQGKGYYVFHDAYEYFEKYYNLTPLGHFTINPEIQPGAKALYKIRKQLIKQKVICIFKEPQFQSNIIKTLSKGTKINIGTLDPLGNDISLNKDSYYNFLLQLATQYATCLK